MVQGSALGCARRRWTPVRRGAPQTRLQRAAAGRAVCRWWLGFAGDGKGVRQQRSRAVVAQVVGYSGARSWFRAETRGTGGALGFGATTQEKD